MDAELVHIQMPDLGDTAKAVIVQWLQPIGSSLHEGDDLLEVETEKATFVIPVPVSGRLASILASETEEVTAGDLLGEIERA